MNQPWTPKQIALRNWTTHSIRCRVCRIDSSCCHRAKRLQAEWHTLHRGTRTASKTVTPR